MTTNLTNSPRTVDAFHRPANNNTESMGAGAGNQADLVNSHSDAIEELSRMLLSDSLVGLTVHGNGLTGFSSSWVGVFNDQGKTGEVYIGGVMHAAFTGSGYLSIDLPTDWQGQAGVESFLLGHAYPMPAFGIHYNVLGVVHAGATELRITAPTIWSAVAAGGGPGFCATTVATDLLTCGAAHGLSVGDKVFVKAAAATVNGGLPPGTYYVTAKNNDGSAFTTTSTTFKLATAPNGNAVNITGSDGAVFVEKAVDLRGHTPESFAIDGISAPFAFTGDNTAPNDDVLFLSGTIFKEAL